MLDDTDGDANISAHAPMRAALVLIVASLALLLCLSWNLFAAPAAPVSHTVQVAFDAADVDASGGISVSEFQDYFHRYAASPPPSSARLASPPASFDNGYMKLSGSVTYPPPPPPMPLPMLVSPLPVANPAVGRAFDNSAMRLNSAPPRQQQMPSQSQISTGGAAAVGSASAAADPDARFIAGVSASCNPRLHAGYAGGSLGWGMTFKVATAQECCEACQAHARTCAQADAKGKMYYRRNWQGKVTDERCPATMSSNELGTHVAQPCNVFTFCPTPIAEGGLCWSNDVWNHTYGARMPVHAQECIHGSHLSLSPASRAELMIRECSQANVG